MTYDPVADRDPAGLAAIQAGSDAYKEYDRKVEKIPHSIAKMLSDMALWQYVTPHFQRHIKSGQRIKDW
jgi:hypothetical protein